MDTDHIIYELHNTYGISILGFMYLYFYVFQLSLKIYKNNSRTIVTKDLICHRINVGNLSTKILKLKDKIDRSIKETWTTQSSQKYPDWTYTWTHTHPTQNTPLPQVPPSELYIKFKQHQYNLPPFSGKSEQLYFLSLYNLNINLSSLRSLIVNHYVVFVK